MNGQDLKKLKLPDLPGVYFFKNHSGEIIYIGRATSLRDRVRSYFGSDLKDTRGSLIVGMVNKSAYVDYRETDSVLEAIILEANLIKKYQPKYNTEEKDNKSFNYLVITKEDFPKVLIIRGRNLEIPSGLSSKISLKFVAGPFPNAGALQESLKFIRKVFPYRDLKCSPSANGRVGKACFNRYLGLCPGICTGEISKKDYAKIINYIIKIFKGEKNAVIVGLGQEMKKMAKEEKFEKALIIKKQLLALTHIRDVALIKDQKLSIPRLTLNSPRIEAYDVAHNSGNNTRGVMVVMKGGEFIKSEYRIFTIKKANGGDDLGALSEMLQRRFNHLEWQFPDVVVIDGGQRQLKVGEKIIKKYLSKTDVVSVVKDDKHKAREILGKIGRKISKNDVIRMNAEAHRFAITTYRRAERRGFFKNQIIDKII